MDRAFCGVRAIILRQLLFALSLGSYSSLLPYHRLYTRAHLSDLLVMFSHKAAQKPAISGFAPPKPAPPPRPVVRPTVSNFYGPKPTAPVAPVNSREAPSILSRQNSAHCRFSPGLSLRELCKQLPSILQDLKALPDGKPQS